MGRLREAMTRLRGRDYELSRRLQRLIENGQVVWGEASYGLPEVETFAHDSTRLIVGKYCSIATGVKFVLGGNHPTDRATTFPLNIKFNLPDAGTDGFPSTRGNIVLGNDVWLGSGCTIVSGASIGDGAVIGAGSIVTGAIPPYSISAGVPARVIKYRFPQPIADEIAALKWWDLPSEVIRRNAKLFSSPLGREELLEITELRNAQRLEPGTQP